MLGWNMVILELSPRERIIRDKYIYYCELCSVNHFAGVLGGSEKWMILISIRDPDHRKYVRRARLWSPDYCSGLHALAAANHRRPRTASTN